MPVVPIADGTNVATRPFAAPRASTDVFGGAPAVPDLSGLASEVHDLYQEQKRKSDQVAVLGAAGAVSNLETTLATQTRQQLGLNAYGAPDAVSKAWQSGISDIGKGLVNDDQKLQFQSVVQSHWNSLNDVVQNHVASQHKVVDQEATDGYTAAEANAAVANYMDPLRVHEAVQNSAAALRAYGERNGQDAAYTDAHVAENTSKIHVAVIDRMLANDQDLAAKKYYDTVKDQIDGQQLPQVDRALELGSSRAESQRQARTIMQGTTTRSDALDKVDQIDDPKVQQLARAEVIRLWGQKDDNAREVMAGKMQSATDIIRQTGDYNRVPPSMLVGLSAENDEALRRYAGVVSQGVPVKTDLPTYNNLQELFANPQTRDTALKTDLNTYIGKLSEGDYKHFSDLQSGLGAKDATTTKKLDGVFTNGQIIDNALKGAGIGIDPTKRKPDAVTTNTLKQTINAQVTDVEQREQRPATTKEVTDITNTILTQHVIDRDGDQVNARIDQMLPTDKLVITAKDIPRTDYRAIVQQLRKQGLPLTDDAVVNAYKASLMSLRRGR